MKMGHKIEEPTEVTSKKPTNPMMYPSLYLSAKESKCVPADAKPGDTFKADCVFKVKSVSVNDNEESGERKSVDLEILELTPEDKGDSDDTKKSLGYDRKSDPNYKRMQGNKEKMPKPKAKDLQK
jgi:hypothetical protein